MIPEHIIKLVIDNGDYWPKIRSEVANYELELVTARETGKWQELIQKYVHANMALDPLFWQALGKVKGWPTTEERPGFWVRNYAHKFFEVILLNGDTKAYWDNLK